MFRLVADTFVFAGLVMLRLLVMFFPAVAVIGVMAPMASVVRQVANIGGASVVNVVAFSVGSTIHTTAIRRSSPAPQDVGMGMLALVLCSVVTLAAFVVLYPLLSSPRSSGSPTAASAWSRRPESPHGLRVIRKGTGDGNEDAQQHQARPSGGGASPAGTGRPVQTRRVNLPAESFGRPSPVLHAHPGEPSGPPPAPPSGPLAELEPAPRRTAPTDFRDARRPGIPTRSGAH